MIAFSLDILQWAGWSAVAMAGAAMAFIYAALETGIYVMNKLRLDLRAESGSHSARRIRRVIRNQGNLLAVLLIGSNVMTYAATFAVGAMFVLAGHEEHAEWYTMLVAGPILFVVAEAVPKNVAQRVGERLVHRLSPVLAVSHWMFNACGLAPLLRGFSGLVMRMLGRRQDSYIPMGHAGLTALVADVQATGVLTHLQTVMADRIIHIGQIKLAQVMIPMEKVASVPAGASREQLLEVMQKHNHSRFPVLDANGQVISMWNIYDALAGEPVTDVSVRGRGHEGTATHKPSGRMPDLLALEDSASVTDALYRMQRAHAPIAVIAHEGRHVGIVTIKDLVEEIVGEIETT